jgi:hypothetical protein
MDRGPRRGEVEVEFRVWECFVYHLEVSLSRLGKKLGKRNTRDDGRDFSLNLYQD